MKKITKFFAISAVVISAGCGFQACHSEAPFSMDGEGEVSLNVEVNSRVTRADDDDLKKNARIYISNESGVLHKWVGVNNIDSKVYLRYGTYKAEAMAGTKSAASFDDKYFVGETDFEVGEGSVSTQVTVTCKIANVVASVDEETIDSKLIKNLKVTIGHSKARLDYTGETVMNYGYFTMPEGETSLNYTVSGTHGDNSFTKSGVIEDVEPGHNYRLQFQYNPEETNNGGAFLTITIADENLIEDNIIIMGAPAFAWSDESMDLDSQIIGKRGDFNDVTLKVAAFNGFESITLKTANETIANILGKNEINLIGISNDDRNTLSSGGIVFEQGETQDNTYRYYITFTKEFLNSLPDSEDPEAYVISVEAKDKQSFSKSGSQSVRIANTEASIVYTAPLQVSIKEFENDLTAVRANSVMLPITIAKKDIVDPAVLYREKGTETWNKTAIEVTRATAEKYDVKIGSLKPTTEYEYKLVAGALVDDKYEYESDVYKFTTEDIFIIPNAGLEDWSNLSSDNKVLIPGADGIVSFWDTGNHGSATMSKLVTNQSDAMKHSGNYSAELKSQFVGIGSSIGKFAAGNLFSGTYVKTDGTDGILSFGREYNGSHPTSLSVWVNYIPEKVTDKKTDNLNNREYDLGQIYVALSTEPIEIRTKTSNQKLFNKDEDCILAYGEYTFDSNYGENGALKQLSIPISYKGTAKSIRPMYLIIVCSASKYGDYFEGGRGSVMYVDDFELVYE